MGKERFQGTAADFKAAWLLASDSADRFRDVVCQVLGLDANPGDDELVRRLLAAHGKAGEPESTRWRDFLQTTLSDPDLDLEAADE